MGTFDTLFGSGGTTSKVVKESIWTPEQQALAKQLMGTLDFGPAAKAPAMSVDTTGEEQRYLNFIKSLASNKAFGNLLAGKPGYDVGPEWAAKYFEEGIRPEYLREWEQTTLPQIRESYAGPTFWGTQRMQEESRAAGNLASELAAKRAELMYGEELAGREATEKAYERILPALTTGAETYGAAGELSRSIAQEKVAEQLQRFLMGEEVGGQYMSAYNPNVQLALQMLGFTPYAIGTETTQTGPGLFSGLLSSASEQLGTMAGTAAGAALFASDRGLKRDLKKVGDLYEFKYDRRKVDIPGTFVGMMAQDVKKNFPHDVAKARVGSKEYLAVSPRFAPVQVGG